MNSNETLDICTPLLKIQPKIIDFEAELLGSVSHKTPSIFLAKNDYEEDDDPDRTPLVIDGKIVNNTNVNQKKIDLDEMERQIIIELAPPEKKKEETLVFKADITQNRLYRKRMERRKAEGALNTNISE